MDDLESPATRDRVIHLHRGGTSVVIDLESEEVPVIVHWGEELADSTPETLRSLAVAARPQRVSGGLDRTARLSAVATEASGWLGTPTIEGHRGGVGFSIKPEVVEVRVDHHAAAVELQDAEAGIRLRWDVEVGVAGLLHQRMTVSNTGDGGYSLDALQLAFPTPGDATELLDTTGHHLRERSAQRHVFTLGTHLRESRRGRPGADATVLLAAGRPGFGFESGRVHGIHVAWSGNHRVLAERVVTGDAFLAGGELFAPGEVVIAPGASVSSPWVLSLIHI